MEVNPAVSSCIGIWRPEERVKTKGGFWGTLSGENGPMTKVIRYFRTPSQQSELKQLDSHVTVPPVVGSGILFS
jgi:hypothetical protein